MAIDTANDKHMELHLRRSLRRAGYELKWDLTATEFAATARLRKRVFCDELGWVPKHSDLYELDEFDTGTTTIAVFDGAEPVACLRVHLPSAPWMACTTFARVHPLLATEAKSRVGCEVSRLAIAPEYRRVTFADGTRPAEALYRALFTYCVAKRMRYVYMIVSRPVLRSLQRAGLPCEPLGPGRIMEDGVHALAARLDWVGFVRHNRVADPARLERFSRTLLLARRKPAGKLYSSSSRSALAMA
jgi:N-acyl-L-homoserine lactone synthetase